MPDRPLFVVGCMRSGTTVVRRILNTHPEVWLSKETQYLAFLDREPGDWHRERTAAELDARLAGARPFLIGNGFTVPADLDAFLASGAPRTDAALYRWICLLERPADRAPRWWGDNSPRYVSLIPELDRAWPDARWLHVVRDPRDVVRSQLETPFGGNTALTAALEWVERVGAGLAAERLVGPRMCWLRFEDLVADPRRELARVAAFLDVEDRFDPDDTGGDAGKVAALAHLGRVARPLDPSVVGRWRGALTPAEVAQIEQLVQPFLAPFGYDQDRWRAAWNPTPRFGTFARSFARSWGVNLARGLRRRWPGGA